MSSHPRPRAAIFLDRDGTLIEDRGYLSDPQEVIFYKDAFPILRELQKHFLLFIITNQSGVSRGIHSKEDVDRVNDFVEKKLQEEGISIEKTYSCYHQREDKCPCIKPNPYFAQRAAEEYGLSLEYSWALGDHYHDVLLAENFGGVGLYLLTGHGESHRQELPKGLPTYRNLMDAGEFILNHRKEIPSNYFIADEAADILRSGGIVAIPTETVYGLAGLGLKEDAVLKIFEAKNRPHFDPLILHGSSLEQLEPLVSEFPPRAKLLAERFWPGPLTLVLPRTKLVPDLVTSGLETVALRVPSHPIARKILELVGSPLAAPSANPFGEVSPTRAIHVQRQLKDRISGIVDGGAATIGIESTIVGYWDGEFRLLRQGGIAQEDIEEVIGKIQGFQSSGDGDVPAPGTMKRHYSPQTNMILLDAEEEIPTLTGSVGFLTFGPQETELTDHVENLSAQGDLKEAAIHLYHYMRKLDRANLDYLVAFRVPQKGLGRGINDRLERAAARD